MAEGGGGDGCRGGTIGLGDGRVRTSMFPWIRELERTVLLKEGVVEEIDDDEDGEER